MRLVMYLREKWCSHYLANPSWPLRLIWFQSTWFYSELYVFLLTSPSSSWHWNSTHSSFSVALFLMFTIQLTKCPNQWSIAHLIGTQFLLGDQLWLGFIHLSQTTEWMYDKDHNSPTSFGNRSHLALLTDLLQSDENSVLIGWKRGSRCQQK